MRGSDAFYYMEIEGGKGQAEQVGALTDAILATLSLE